MKNCWWCGNPATTREHKYKKSQLKRCFSSKEDLVWFSGKTTTQFIKGLNSKRLKFDTSLCNICNNQRSQPYDKAYDAFVLYIDHHSSEVIAKEQIDLENVYPNQGRKQFALLLGYLVKHISCRLAECNNTIPPNFIDFLNGKDSLRHLILKFGINCGVLDAQRRLKSDSIDDSMFFLGDFLVFPKKNSFQSHISHNWLFITYRYDMNIPGTSIDLVGNILKVTKYDPVTQSN